jgi:thiamine kinase-like enzyme
MGGRLKILLAGMLAGVPRQGGASWAALQYLEGLTALGHEVLFVEEVPQGALGGDAGIEAYFRALPLSGRVAALIERGSERTLGAPFAALQRFAHDADLLLNLSGTLHDERLLAQIPVRAFVDLDPAFNQLWHEQGHDLGLDLHTHFATVGALIGTPECRVPTCGREWIATLPPVSLPHWPSQTDPPRRDAFTTVGHWRSYGSIEHEGVHYGQRAHSLRAIVDLPRRTRSRFQLALGIHREETADLQALSEHGWELLDPQAVAATPAQYEGFVRESKAEICVAKSGYVASRCGWLSDRSACYLASGRPVVAQDTGFDERLPSGEGLLSFATVEEAAAAVAAIEADPARHAAAARAIAEEHLDARTVLSRLIERLGAAPRQSGGASIASPLETSGTSASRSALAAGSEADGSSASTSASAAGTAAVADRPGGADGPCHASGPTDAQVRKALARVLASIGAGEPVEVTRRRSQRRSTFPLERLTVDFRDGGQLQIAFKRLMWEELTEDGRTAKPSFTFDPAREAAVYAQLLPLAPAGPARYLGSVTGEEEVGRWLFLEWVNGRPLQEVGERAIWDKAAHWLAGMHVALAHDLERHVVAAGLLQHDAAQCRLWLERARRFAKADGRDTPAARFLDRLDERYDVVVEALLQLPRTVMHGDFHAANVLVGSRSGDVSVHAGVGERPRDDGSDRARIAPVDWEMAAAGPGLLDLAALVSGDWEDAERQRMVAAYASVRGVPPFTERQLDLARLHHAVQWLGWAPRSWRPPVEQRHDWLADAQRLAEQLEI